MLVALSCCCLNKIKSPYLSIFSFNQLYLINGLSWVAGAIVNSFALSVIVNSFSLSLIWSSVYPYISIANLNVVFAVKGAGAAEGGIQIQLKYIWFVFF